MYCDKCNKIMEPKPNFTDINNLYFCCYNKKCEDYKKMKKVDRKYSQKKLV